MKLKRMMAIVLCFAMVLSTMSFSVFAADDYVAYIGEQGYETLQLALDAAKDETNIEIKLVADATLDINAWDTLAIGGENTESITINGNNHTLTFNHLNSDWNNVVTKNGAKLILNNMKITNSGYNDGPWNRHDINFACDVELNNVSSDKALAFKAGAVLDTVTISDANTSDTYAIWIQSNGQTVTITNSTIDMLDCTDGRGIKIANEYVEGTEQKVTLTVTGTSFKTEEKAAILVCSTKGADITLSDVNINDVEADTQNAVWNDEDTADYLSLIEVTGGTVKQEGATSVAYVAQIEGGASFASLADAVVAAESGDIITILQSGDYEMPQFKDKELTFIGVDKENTTINDWVEKNSQGMSGSTVHFKDLTISGQTNNYYGLFHTKGVTYENCNINGLRFLYSPTTFTDCAFDANGVEHSFWTYGASEVTVNNCTFKYTDRAVNCYSEAGADHETNITFEECTFIYTGTADAPEGAIEINSGSSKSIDLALKDCIAPTKGEMWFNSRWDSKKGANTTVTVDDTQVWPVVVNVATIGDKKYTSLQAAIDAAQTDDVITIISDIVMTTENYVTNSDGYAAMLNVAGKSVTIDLNGKNIKVEAAADALANAKDTMLMAVFAVDTNGTLTLEDNIGTGTVDVTANDAKVCSLAAAYGKGSKLNIESGSYTVDKVSSALIYSQYDKAVTVSGGNFRLDNVGTGLNGSPWIVNVSGQGDGYVSITGGTFNANIQRQYWTTEVKVPVSHYMSKNADDTWTVKEGSAVSVKEGTLFGPYYESDFEVGYPSLQAFLDAANANLPITIDSYDPITLLKDCSENINIDIVLNESEENNERTLTLNLNGHQYSGTITLCHKDNVLISGEGLNVVSGVAGYKVQYANGMYTLIEAPKSYIAQVGETKYTDLKEALDACTNGETIMIIDDITYDANDIVYAHGGATGFGNYDQYNPSIIYVGGTKGATPAENQPSNVNAVIDLNGHTITNNADSYLFIIMDNAKVTFTDSLGGGGVVGNSKNYPVIWSVGSETLVTIEKGNYITNSALGLLHSTHSGDLVIEGGEFSTTANDASLLIMLNSQKYNNPNYFLKGIATVAIKGGTFHGFNPEKVGDDYGASSIEEIKFVDGCADGFAPIDNGNGIYSVVDYVQWIKDELLAGRDVTLTRDVVVDGSYITSEPHAVNSNGKYPNYGIFTVVGDYDVTIDLNGYDVTYNGHADFEWNGKTYNSCTVAHGLFFANGGADLTIKDSAETSDITVYGLASGAYVATPNTTLTIEGGKWKNVGCATCGGTNIFLYPLQGGELYITNGHFDQALDSEGESYLIVEHGGAYANSVIDYSKTKVEISGGTFVGMNPEKIKKFNQTADNKLDTTTEPTTNGCANGFEVVINDDGTFGVQVDSATSYVAKVGNKSYKSFVKAVEEANAVAEGATIELLKDVTLGETLEIKGNVTISGEHTITRADNYTGTLFAVNAEATLTLDGGLVVDGGNAWNYIKDPLEMDMANGAGTNVGNHITPAENGVNATASLIKNNGTLNANRVTIENNYSTNGVSAIDCGTNSATILNGAVMQKIAANRSGAVVFVGGNDAVLTITGKTKITGNFGIGNGGIIQNYGQGTTVNMEGGSIDNNHIGNSGTLYASYSGNANKINTFNMSGGIITKNIMEGYGPVYIHTNTVWNMTGGEISENTSFLPNYVRNNNPAGIMSGGKIVNNKITGTDYSNGYYVTRPDLRLNGKTGITGGEFTQDVTEYLAPNIGLVYNEETGIYSLTQELYEYNGVAYKTFSEVIEKIKSAPATLADEDKTPVVKVLASHKVDDAIVIDTNIVLDLGGNTLNGNIIVEDGAVATIKNGTVNSTNKQFSAIESIGTVTVEDVDVNYAKHGLRVKAGSAIVDGGTYTPIGTPELTTHAVNVGGEGVAANVVINSGTFNGPRGTNSDSGSSVMAQADASVTINGGLFVKGKNATIKNNEHSTVVITGGTFDMDPAIYVDTKTYSIFHDSYEKLWTVYEGWTVKATVEPEEVYEGEEVVVTIVAEGNNFAMADWKLTYEKENFEYAGVVTPSDEDIVKTEFGYISGTKMAPNGQNTFNSDNSETILAQYKFTAKAKTEVTTANFGFSQASVGEQNMSKNTLPKAKTEGCIARILLRDFVVNVTHKNDGKPITDGKLSFPYDGMVHKVVVTTVPTGAKVEYSVDGGNTWTETVPEFTKYGEYELMYKIDVPAGYIQDAKNPATVKISVTDPDVDIEVVDKYVQGYSMILVYTDLDNTYFNYGDSTELMLDVTAAGYKYVDDQGNTSAHEYDHVYAYVVPWEMMEDGTYAAKYSYKEKVKYNPTATKAPDSVDPYDYDINCSGDATAAAQANLADVGFTNGVYNAVDDSMKPKLMKLILKADANRNGESAKTVDTADVAYVKTDYIKGR